MKKVFDIVKQAQTAALKAARPGVPLEALDAAARKVIVDAGYGPGFKYFSHRVGHGMGMDGHEWPYLVKNNMFGWEKALHAAAGHDLQRRAGDLHPRGVRRAARGRHAHHRTAARSSSRRSRSRWKSRSETLPASSWQFQSGDWLLVTGLFHARHERPDLREVHLFDRHRLQVRLREERGQVEIRL